MAEIFDSLGSGEDIAPTATHASSSTEGPATAEPEAGADGGATGNASPGATLTETNGQRKNRSTSSAQAITSSNRAPAEWFVNADQPGNHQERRALAASTPEEAGSESAVQPFKLLKDYRRMMEAAAQESPPLLGDLRRRQVTIFAGPPGVGKTVYTVQMLCGLAAGAPFAGHTPAGPVKVVLLSVEDGDTELGQRMAACARLMGLDEALLQENFRVADFSAPFLLFRRGPEGVELTEKGREFADELAAFGVSCLVLDPISALHDLPENDNGMMTLLMAAQQQLARELDCAIINLHHFGKETADRPTLNSCRGASAIGSVARNVQFFVELAADEIAALDIAEGEELNHFRQFPGKLSHAERAGKIAYFRRKRVQLDGFTGMALEQISPPDQERLAAQKAAAKPRKAK